MNKTLTEQETYQAVFDLNASIRKMEDERNDIIQQYITANRISYLQFEYGYTDFQTK